MTEQNPEARDEESTAEEPLPGRFRKAMLVVVANMVGEFGQRASDSADEEPLPGWFRRAMLALAVFMVMVTIVGLALSTIDFDDIPRILFLFAAEAFWFAIALAMLTAASRGSGAQRIVLGVVGWMFIVLVLGAALNNVGILE